MKTKTRRSIHTIQDNPWTERYLSHFERSFREDSAIEIFLEILSK